MASGRIRFEGSQRLGTAAPDMRVWLPIPGLGDRLLSVKDHHLLGKTDSAGDNPGERAKMLNLLIQQMGKQIAVRVGLSRAFSSRADGSQRFCWLMAAGFSSLDDPQI